MPFGRNRAARKPASEQYAQPLYLNIYGVSIIYASALTTTIWTRFMSVSSTNV